MHKKLINDLHNIAFGKVSSVGNYYSNVEKNTPGKSVLAFQTQESWKVEEKGRKNVKKKKNFKKQTLAVKSVFQLSSKKEGRELKTVQDLQAESER